MLLAEFEHLIRAAATITDDDELIVIGSQAVLAQFPDAPENRAPLVGLRLASLFKRRHKLQ